MLYFGYHSILNRGSTAAHCKNDSSITGDTPTVLCAFHLILCLVLIQFMGQSDLIEKKMTGKKTV